MVVVRKNDLVEHVVKYPKLMVCEDVIMLMLNEESEGICLASSLQSNYDDFKIGAYYKQVEYGIWEDFDGTVKLTNSMKITSNNAFPRSGGFPKLMIGNSSGTIVWMLSVEITSKKQLGKGVCVIPNIGEYNAYWDYENFTDYDGEVLLYNDKNDVIT
jgi:hypothetical protein